MGEELGGERGELGGRGARRGGELGGRGARRGTRRGGEIVAYN